MAQIKRKLTMATCLEKYEDVLVTNFSIQSKMPLQLDRAKIQKVFQQVANIFTKMTDASFPEESEIGTNKEEYSLVERDPSISKRSKRTLSIRRWRLVAAALHPLKASEQEETIQNLVSALDSEGFVTPFLIDYADFRFVFEFGCVGNQHKMILDVLFKDSSFAKLTAKISGKPLVFKPVIYIGHPTDNSLLFAAEMQPMTTKQEIDSGKYDKSDWIAAITSMAKIRDFSPQDTLSTVSEQLRQECLKIVEKAYLGNIIEPLSKHLRRKKRG